MNDTVYRSEGVYKKTFYLLFFELYWYIRSSNIYSTNVLMDRTLIWLFQVFLVYLNHLATFSFYFWSVLLLYETIIPFPSCPKGLACSKQTSQCNGWIQDPLCYNFVVWCLCISDDCRDRPHLREETRDQSEVLLL